MKKTTKVKGTDQDVQALLARHQCPVPFHEVRTRLLGNIATPCMAAQPFDVVKDLWGGELPVFETSDDLQKLIGVLINGLWNRLARHQKRDFPFRLHRVERQATRDVLTSVAQMRHQEIDGFIEGLFGQADDLDLPEKASLYVSRLEKWRSMFHAFENVLGDPDVKICDERSDVILKSLQKITLQAEKDIHAIVLSCVRARRQSLALFPRERPTFH